MGAGGRIKNRRTVHDVKAIDRRAFLRDRVRKAVLLTKDTVAKGEEAAAAGDDSAGRMSPESGAVGRVSATAEMVVLRGARKAESLISNKARKSENLRSSKTKNVDDGHHRVKPFSVKDKSTYAARPAANTIMAERAVKQGKRAAEIKSAARAAKSAKTVRSLKGAGNAVMRALRAITAAARSLTMLIMAGGWIVLLVMVIIVIAAAIASSITGIFLSNDGNSGGVMAGEVVRQLGDEFSEYIQGIEDSNPHDELVVVYTDGASKIDWVGIISVYVAKVNQCEVDPIEVIFFDDKRVGMLRDVMSDMNEVSHEVLSESRERTVIKEDENGSLVEVTETVAITTLKITIDQKPPDEMAAKYFFSANQRKALDELLSVEYIPLWEELLGGFVTGGGIGEPSKDRIPTGFFTWPLEVAGTITSYFGWREDPFTGKAAYHNGIDIGVESGTPILAAAGGVVTIANGTDSYGGGWGYYVKIGHKGGYETLYAHCSAIAVRAGDSVKQGQIIGFVGNTGRSKGPHLHWELYQNGICIDPLNVFSFM